MSDLKERKPDGGLAEWIEMYEAMGGEDDGEMLVLMLELRRHRINSGEIEAAQQRIAELEARLTACKCVKESWKDRAWTAEEELARRNAAAGEPAFYIAASDIDNLKRAHVVEAAISKVIRFDEIPVYTIPPAPSAPDGWKLVPVEPTEEMLDELDSIIDFGAEDSKDAWKRLITSAAPGGS